MTNALVGFLVLMVLMLVRVPIALALAVVGFAGCIVYIGVDPAISMLGQIVIDTGFHYELSILPLFILMGTFIGRSGISDELYEACYAFLGHLRGGLAMATIAACAGFSAVCGSSLATVATMANVAMPPMRRKGYADSLAAGSIAAGGTLGILIPPSIIMVIYGILTETNIGALFIAGILPGILAVFLYLLAIVIVTRLNPESGPAGDRTSWRDRIASLRNVGIVIALFVFIIGGIYLGMFTATEAGGIGATVSFFICLWRRKLTFPILKEIVADTTQTTAMIFMVLIGALIFSSFINLSGVPSELTAWMQDLGLGAYGALILILVIYLILGCVFDSMAMILLTVPIFFPIMMSFGFHPVWFGVIVVVITEIAMITPPVGMNVFVLRATLHDVPTRTIFRGVLPFVAVDIIRLALLVAFPTIILLLPSMMNR
jgi:tripartite ATP-independent transporter DctM subunit